MKNKKLLRIIIIILIVLVIAGIWAYRNIGQGSEGLSASVGNKDFELEISSIDLDTLKSYGLPIIIDFGSDTCQPCREMAPVLKAMNAEMQGKAIIKYLDVGKYAAAANGYPIQVIPTQVFIGMDGKPYIPGKNINIQFTSYSYKDTGEHAFTIHEGGLTKEQMRSILADMGAEVGK